MNNKDIRNLLKEKGIFNWQLADKLGISEATLTRKLRRELPTEEKEKLIKVIKKMED